MRIRGSKTRVSGLVFGLVFQGAWFGLPGLVCGQESLVAVLSERLGKGIGGKGMTETEENQTP